MNQSSAANLTQPPVDLSATNFVPRDLPTEAEYSTLVAYIEAHGEKRRANHRDFNSVDFVVGAMSVFFALGWQSKLPGAWVFGPMSGTDPLTGEPFTAEAGHG